MLEFISEVFQCLAILSLCVAVVLICKILKGMTAIQREFLEILRDKEKSAK